MANIEQIAKDVAERARAGDQNAMGLIAETRRSAESGQSKRAKETLRAIFRYCESHPISPRENPFRGDEPSFSARTTTALGKLRYLSTIAPKFPAESIADELFLVAQDRNPKARACASLFLANGVRLQVPAINAIADTLGEEHGGSFLQAARGVGMPKSKNRDHRTVVICGRMVAKARAVQMARCGLVDRISKRAFNELTPLGRNGVQ